MMAITAPVERPRPRKNSVVAGLVTPVVYTMARLPLSAMRRSDERRGRVFARRS